MARILMSGDVYRQCDGLRRRWDGPTELDWIHMLGELVGWAGEVREPRDQQVEAFDWSYPVVLDGSRFRETWSTHLLTHPQADLEGALETMAPAPAAARSGPVPETGLR
jgi:hypothetical protein